MTIARSVARSVAQSVARGVASQGGSSFNPLTLSGAVAFWLPAVDSGGMFVPNRVVAGTAVNLVPEPEDLSGSTWSGGGVTVTADYAAGPVEIGGNASRLNMSSDYSGSFWYPTLPSLASGSYTLSFYFKATSGSSVPFRSLIYGAGVDVLTDHTATATWQRATISTTRTAGAPLLMFRGPAAGTADVLITGVQWEASASASPYRTPSGDLKFTDTNGLAAPTWGSNGFSGGGVNGRFRSTTNFSSAITTYSVITQSGMPSDGLGWGTIFPQVDTGGTWPAVMAGFGGGNTGVGGTSAARGLAAPYDLRSARPHVIAMCANGPGVDCYIDGTLVAQYPYRASPAAWSPLASWTAWTQRIWQFINEGGTATIHAAAVYSAKHDAATVRNLTAWIQQQLPTLGVTTNAPLVVADGDSTSSVISLAQWVQPATAAMRPAPVCATIGIAGATTSDLQIQEHYDRLALLDTPARSKRVCVLLVGSNDLSGGTSAATTFAGIKAYTQYLQGKGYRVVNCDIFSRIDAGVGQATFDSRRASVNSLMDGDSVTNQYRLRWSNANIAANAAQTLSPSYWLDSAHLNATGAAVAASEAATVIASALA